MQSTADKKEPRGAAHPMGYSVDGKYTVKRIGAQIVTACGSYRSVPGKHPYQHMGKELTEQTAENPPANRNHKAIIQGMPGTQYFAGSHVLRRNGRYRSQKSGGHKKEKGYNFFHNSHAGRIYQSAAVCYCSNNKECHLNQSILHGYRNTNL